MRRVFYPLVFLLCAIPGVTLLRNALPVLTPAFFPDVVLPWEGDLGVNPVETLLHETGRAGLMLLIFTLAITPVRRLTGWNRVQSVRRMVGIWAFVYALAHFAVYVVFDKLGDVAEIGKDVAERRFIFVGMLAFMILLALALTSTNGMIRRLGRRWQRLHRLVYVAAIAGVVHFAWGQKADIREPLIWGVALAVLLAIRVWFALRRARRTATTSTPKSA
jgi:methionine sulfoxide reductase heme-binding subunit